MFTYKVQPDGDAGTQQPKPANPCIMVIFGATGDLTKRLLVPALYNLATDNLLPENFALLGLSRSGESDEAFREEVNEFVQENAGVHSALYSGTGEEGAAWRSLLERVYYNTGDFDNPETYQNLKKRLAELDKKHETGANVLFYLATAPEFFIKIINRLGEAGLVEENGNWRRVIIEKPFGNSLQSARELNQKILKILDEKQVFRMDHFLGKETVQNILALRFANGFLEPLWNRDHIDHIQISVTETVGVEKRGSFYESTGAMRDMVPNHLFQLLTIAAMETPTSFDADALRNEKVKVLQSMQRMTPERARKNAVRGQYGAGEINGKQVRNYRDEPNVDPNSNTETYVAMKLKIDNWRWAGVPFYLRTGKSLAKRESEIAIRFKQAPFALFRDTPVEALTPNYMVLHIQPAEGVSMNLNAKIPGPTMRLGGVGMSFAYKDYFDEKPRTGYETLLYDCMMGDATLFQRADNVEGGWEAVQPILDLWAEEKPADFPNYAAGSWGPKAADELFESGRHWRLPKSDD